MINMVHSLIVLSLVTVFGIPASTDTFPGDNVEEGSNVSFSLEEELPVGTLIGSLSERLPSKPHVSIASAQFTPLGLERFIRLNQTTGQLFVRSRIDREALCEQIGTCCITETSPDTLRHPFTSAGYDTNCAIRLVVMDQRGPPAYSSVPQRPNLVHISFFIVDINDNPPTWSPDTLELEIPEHSPVGASVQLPEASDPDQSTESSLIRYELIPQIEGTNDFSRYESRHLGDIFSLSVTPLERSFESPQRFNLQIKVNADLDREKRDSYRLLLIAIDDQSKGPSPGSRTGTLNILVKVTDINDQAPFFTQQHLSIEVTENVVPGTRIFTMTAKDDDPSDATRLIYRFGSTATGEVKHLFNLCEKTGGITVANDLDYETSPFLPEPQTPNSHYNSPSSSSSSSSSSSGGRGKEVGYLIPVRVTDGVHATEAQLRVRLKNVNDNAPNVTIQSHLPRWRNTDELVLSEGVQVGQMVATITVEDADERWLDNNKGSSVETQCLTGHPYFSVQPLFPNSKYQFMLVASRALDREMKSTHTVTITCHDSGQPTLSQRVHLVIHLEDLNDSPPVFTQTLYQAKIAENLPINTPILKVQATDADAGIHAEIQYQIKADMALHDLVKLNAASGQIFTSSLFDREKLASINFTVVAVDCRGGDAGNDTHRGLSVSPVHSATASVLIIIEDVNDCAPEFEHSNYEFVVREGQRPQQLVGRVHAVDNDADPKHSRLQYSIGENDQHYPYPRRLQSTEFAAGGSVRASSLFAITSNGEIYTRNFPIDREKTPILSFSVVAADYGNPPLSAFATVLVRIEDVNDHTPLWVFPQSSNHEVVRVNMSCHATVGREVAHLKAVDADSGENGEIEYEIIKGNELEFFALDRTSGTLYLAKPLNVEAKAGLEGRNSNESTIETAQASPESVPNSFILALKAADKGKVPRSNTTILRVDVIRNERYRGPPDLALEKYGEHGRQLGKNQARYGSVIGDRDMMIITAMIAVALVISLVLIAAIVFLRCHSQPTRRRNSAEGVTYENGVSGPIKNMDVLGCLTGDGTMPTTGLEAGDEKPATKKHHHHHHQQQQQHSMPFILGESERNPNFEELSSKGTPMHGTFEFMNHGNETYGRFNPAVIVSSATLPSGRKVPLMPTEGVSIGYLATSNPNSREPTFVTYEAAHNSEEASSSSTVDAKATYNSLLYRLAEGSIATIDKNYMTLGSEVFQQDVYRKLSPHSGGRWEESILMNDVQPQGPGDESSKKRVLVVSHDGLPGMMPRDIELRPIATNVSEVSKKRCRFKTADPVGDAEVFPHSEAIAFDRSTNSRSPAERFDHL